MKQKKASGKRITVAQKAADAIRKHIESNRPALFRLPPITVLAKQLNVSVVNVHRALHRLQDEGLVEVMHGKGAFTRSPVQRMRKTADRPAIGMICQSYEAAIDCLADEGGFFCELIRGANEEAESLGYGMAMHWVQPDIADNPGLWPAMMDFARGNRIKGLMLLGFTRPELIAWTVRQFNPCMLIDHWAPNIPVDTVNPDNRGAAYAAAHQLIRAGHKRILYVFHRKRELNPPRLQGYEDALRDAGIPLRRNLIVYASDSETGGRDAYEKAVRNRLEISAVMTFGRNQARGVLQAAQNQGKPIPVATFGSVASKPEENPLVIAMHPKETGRCAMRRMAERLARPDLPAQDLIPTNQAQTKGKGHAFGAIPEGCGML